MRNCKDCGIEIAPYQHRCPEHKREAKLRQTAEWRDRNPEHVKAAQFAYDQKRNKTPERKAQKKNRSLEKFYGLTLEQFNAKVAEQNGLCLCCGVRPATDTDHDWFTGQIRGILCPECNKGLGLLGDDSAGAHAGLRYLALHEGAFLGAGL